MTVAVLAFALGCSDKTDDTAPAGSFVVEQAVYAFESSGAEWIAPAGFGDVVPAHTVLLGVRANGPDAVHLTLALGGGSLSNPHQLMSRRTLELGGSLDRDGHFVSGPEDVDAEGADAYLVIHDLVVSGTIADSALVDLTLKGTLDAQSASEPPDPQDIKGFCGLAAEYGALCGPCPDGEARCVPFEVNETEARKVPDFDLTELATGTWCASVLFLPIGTAAVRIRRRKATA
jgi:hypothetical protein